MNPASSSKGEDADACFSEADWPVGAGLLPERLEDRFLCLLPVANSPQLFTGQNARAVQLHLGEFVHREEVLHSLQAVSFHRLPVASAVWPASTAAGEHTRHPAWPG